MNGKVIRGIRLRHGLTQQSLADKIGVSRNLIDAIESGRTGVSDRTRAKLASHFIIDDDILSFLENYEKMNGIIHDYTLTD